MSLWCVAFTLKKNRIAYWCSVPQFSKNVQPLEFYAILTPYLETHSDFTDDETEAHNRPSRTLSYKHIADTMTQFWT